MGNRAVELLRTKPRVFWGSVVRVFLARGWTPPPMSDETFGRITDDMAKLGSAYPTATLKLSPMERKILEHLAEGMSNQEIADALGIGFETVRERAFGIRARLGARNAAHAVALGFRAGILR